MLKYETNEVPTGLESHYEDVGNGIHRLKVEGVVSKTELETTKTKLGEFRDNNVTLKKQLEDFSKLFGEGISPDKMNSKIEELALQRAGEMKTSYETQLTELTGKLTQTQSHLERVVLSDSVKAAAISNGVVDTALDDVLFRAQGAFQVVDGQLQAKDKNLDSSGKPFTVDTWMKSLATTAPHLFAPSTGGGARTPAKVNAPSQEPSAIDKIQAGLSKLRK